MKNNKSSIRKKAYQRPTLEIVAIDSDLSLAMVSDPPGDPTGIGIAPGYVQKGIKFLIR